MTHSWRRRGVGHNVRSGRLEGHPAGGIASNMSQLFEFFHVEDQLADFHNQNSHLRDRDASPILSAIWSRSWSEAHSLVLGCEGALNSDCLVGVLNLGLVSKFIV